jgi:hypothetical protein
MIPLSGLDGSFIFVYLCSVIYAVSLIYAVSCTVLGSFPPRRFMQALRAVRDGKLSFPG